MATVVPLASLPSTVKSTVRSSAGTLVPESEVFRAAHDNEDLQELIRQQNRLLEALVALQHENGQEPRRRRSARRQSNVQTGDNSDDETPEEEHLDLMEVAEYKADMQNELASMALVSGLLLACMTPILMSASKKELIQAHATCFLNPYSLTPSSRRTLCGPTSQSMVAQSALVLGRRSARTSS
jgi:hypothetical protein